MKSKSITHALAASLMALTVGGAAQTTAHTPRLTQSTATQPAWRAFSIADLTGSAELQEHLQALGRTEVSEAEAALGVFLSRRERARATANALLQAALRHAAPAFDDQNQVRLEGISVLLVSATAEHEAWVESFLDLQRQETALVQMGVTLYSMPFGSSAKLGLKEIRQTLESTAIKALKTKLAALPQAKVISNPRVSVHPLQLATIAVIDQTTYIKDYELVVVQPGSREIATPIIGTLDAGMCCKLRAVPLGGKRYSVEVHFEHSRLAHLREFETTLDGALKNPVTLSLPEVTRVQLESWPTLALGQALVLQVPDEEAGHEHLMILKLGAAELPDPKKPL